MCLSSPNLEMHFYFSDMWTPVLLRKGVFSACSYLHIQVFEYSHTVQTFLVDQFHSNTKLYQYLTLGSFRFRDRVLHHMSHP